VQYAGFSVFGPLPGQTERVSSLRLSICGRQLSLTEHPTPRLPFLLESNSGTCSDKKKHS